MIQVISNLITKNNISMVSIITIIIVATSFLFLSNLKVITDISSSAFDKKMDKPMGIITVIFYILIPIELLALKNIQFNLKVTIYIIVLVVFHIIGQKQFDCEKNKIIGNLGNFIPDNKKKITNSIISMVLLISSGLISSWIFLKNKDSHTALELGFRLACLYIYTILISGYYYSIAIINNIKSYTIVGEEIRNISKTIYHVDDNKITGYIVSTDDKYIIFKPYNHNLIRIRNEDIKFCIYN
ncbi:hypothetical protein Z957_02025 [Clostridium sp. K25]|uniref:hypothetical protein n=1 Tax=Clostridium sp. K25 TaxID=1443109 RepID=UPI0004D9D1C0|nr:hypothetical protein [Clostridium sp. K25]KEI10535.1 hypothetical protein Z957_02025 [Clostridium sp. K25]